MGNINKSSPPQNAAGKTKDQSASSHIKAQPHRSKPSEKNLRENLILMGLIIDLKPGGFTVTPDFSYGKNLIGEMRMDRDENNLWEVHFKG